MEKQLATYAALITQVLKKGTSITPADAIVEILEQTDGDFNLNLLIESFNKMAKELNIDYFDINHLIFQLQIQFQSTTTNTLWNSTCQTIAQAIYVGLLIAKALPLPSKWRSIVEAVIDAYEGVKK